MHRIANPSRSVRLRPAPPNHKVTVNVTLLDGCFSRKSKADFVEAAMVSKGTGGKPVKVTWTLEDDLHNDYFHAVSAQHLEAGLDANGKVVAWLHRAAEPTIISGLLASRR